MIWWSSAAQRENEEREPRVVWKLRTLNVLYVQYTCRRQGIWRGITIPAFPIPKRRLISSLATRYLLRAACLPDCLSVCLHQLWTPVGCCAPERVSGNSNLETMLIIVPPVVTLLLYKSRKYASSFKVLASDKKPQKSDPRPPRRITSNVKQNLQYLKIVKEYQKKASSSAPKPATSYRKKKVEKSDLGDEIDSYEDPTTKLYYTNSGLEMATPVLLVDGYNVCGYWPKLKKHFSKGDLETARQKLLDELVGFSAIKGVKVVVVFDATLSGLTSRKETLQNVDVVYTVDACADSWIEREVTMLIADGCPKVWVVSSDTFHQHAAYGAGAYIWNCKVLITEIKDAKKELQELMHDDSMYSVKGKLLEHNLDPEAFSALQNLKQQLKNPEGG